MDNIGSPAMMVNIQSYMTVSEFTPCAEATAARLFTKAKQPLLVTAITKESQRRLASPAAKVVSRL
jgi:hypothetical protein